jgi:sortase A
MTAVPQVSGRFPGWQRLTSRSWIPSPGAVSAYAAAVLDTPSALALVIVASLATWLVLFAVFFSGFEENHSQHDLYARFRSELAGETAPLGGVISQGSPVALLTLPAAGLHNEVVVEGTTGVDLATGPGHLPGTPLPGQAGDSEIFGRALTFGAPFGRLAALHPGDLAHLTTAQGPETFRVIDVRRPGQPMPAALPAGQSRLTLVTAHASGWRSGWAPSQILYVDAALVGKVLPAPAPVALARTTSEKPMASDGSGLSDLVLWLEALLASVVGGVWLASRWGVSRTWPIALPLILATLWAASAAALPLLPNLM